MKMADRKGGYHGVVVSFFRELLERYNDIMHLDITFQDDADDKKDIEPKSLPCFCHGKSGHKSPLL